MNRIDYQVYGIWNQAPLDILSDDFDDCIAKKDLEHLFLPPQTCFSKALFHKMIECIECSPNLKYFNYSKVHLQPEYLNKLLETLEACPKLEVIEMEDCAFKKESSESFTSLIIGSMSLRKINISCCIPAFFPRNLQDNFMSAILKSSSLEEVIAENRMELNAEVKIYLTNNKNKNLNKDEDMSRRRFKM